MTATMLQLRMEALAQHLKEQDPETLLSCLNIEPKPDKNSWFMAEAAIGREAETLLADLQKAMDSYLAGASRTEEIWDRYFQIYERSLEIFRENLELLGGLALRDRIQEEYACRFADELISECAELVGKPTSFAIPATEDTTEDTLASTLRRVARVTFPDWHLWALPLVAHEYGEVVVRETILFSRFVDELAQEASKPTLGKLCDGLRSRLQAIGDDARRTIAMEYPTRAQKEPGNAADVIESLVPVLRANEPGIGDLAQATADQIRDCLREATNRARMLVADAFATFTAGPAYACAALMLRLNPNAPRLPSRPTDEDRARTILAVLAEMDVSDPATPPPFMEVRESLAASWGLLVEDSGSGGPSQQGEWSLDAADALRKIKYRMVRQDRVGYTKTDWIRAKRWGDRWYLEVSKGDTPEVSADGPGLGDMRLRDVLNAAWHCRLQIIKNLPQQDVESATGKVMNAARQLCDRILMNRKTLADPLSFGGRAPWPGEVRA